MDAMHKKLIISLQSSLEMQDSLYAARERLCDYPDAEEDENWTPDRYTPSLRECREKLEQSRSFLKGFCLALDIVFGFSYYGLTEQRVYDMMASEDKPYRLRPSECCTVDHDASSSIGDNHEPAYKRMYAILSSPDSRY